MSEEPAERPPHELPAAYRARVFADLAIGESAPMSCYVLIVLPDGKCFVDQYMSVHEGVGERVVVTKLSEQTCRIDLKHVGDHRFLPRPVQWSLYPFEVWKVIEIVAPDA